MHLTVVCSDDPVRSVDEPIPMGVRRRHAPLGGQKFAQEMVELYATIAVPELPETTDVDVTTDMPTLILIGGLDAATPTFRSAVVAKWLPRARLVVFPDGMQVQLSAVHRCAARIVTTSVRDPGAPLPLECVQESRFPASYCRTARHP